jgi:hypothetical protein
MIFHLNDPKQAHSILTTEWPKMKAALEAGKHLVMEIKAASKSREQEEKYHAMIGDIAKQAKHLGSHWDADTWKRLLVDKFVREQGISSQIMANLDGNGIVQLGFQTRNFTKEQASEFVEWLYAWAADNGVTL